MIIIFDKFRNYIFEITNVHINQEGKLISILNIFLNKGSSIELISEETKKFTRMKEFTQKFLKTYFMEQNKA
jgi:outer membrane protein assembly factor BamE (lipoprotein component of BamABCDE complex)